MCSRPSGLSAQVADWTGHTVADKDPGFPHVADAIDIISDNEGIAEAAERHPDRFIPFVSISPERRIYRKAYHGKVITGPSEIQRGDFVVHMEHGIGVFEQSVEAAQQFLDHVRYFGPAEAVAGREHPHHLAQRDAIHESRILRVTFAGDELPSPTGLSRVVVDEQAHQDVGIEENLQETSRKMSSSVR